MNLPRRRRFPFVLLGILLTAVILIIFFVRRQSADAAFGPPVALCPGPDNYGYTCDSGAGFAYIDATTDTQLYADDGTITLQLPFPFTFYGTTYTEINASSNGNVQFGNANPFYLNSCLDNAPVPEMGDMIAPYWDDLDLTFFGFLEYDVVGEAPQRIFVLEWDNVPYFGGEPDDTVTFELQLFEETSDIVFLYEDVVTFEASNGNSATIGIQSESQGVSLQYGCDQPVVTNSTGLHIAHPNNANNVLGLTAVLPTQSFTTPLTAKGPIADITTQLQLRNGTTILRELQLNWYNQPTSLTSTWQWANVAGDAQEELIVVWQGPSNRPDLTQLAIFEVTENGRFALYHQQSFTTRKAIEQQSAINQIVIHTVAQLTNDNLDDLIIEAPRQNQQFVLTNENGAIDLYPLPQTCTGQMGTIDTNQDGRLDIVRNDCQGKRLILTWDGTTFSSAKN